jgi:uncharacterized protein DUF5989
VQAFRPAGTANLKGLHYTGSRIRGSGMSKGRVLGEFFSFLKQEKKYWLVPIVIVFVLFGLLIVFSQSSAVAPFIYTLF